MGNCYFYIVLLGTLGVNISSQRWDKFLCFLARWGKRTAQCIEEPACQHVSDEQNLKFS